MDPRGIWYNGHSGIGFPGECDSVDGDVIMNLKTFTRMERADLVKKRVRESQITTCRRASS
jgi:hypothetical protein